MDSKIVDSAPQSDRLLDRSLSTLAPMYEGFETGKYTPLTGEEVTSFVDRQFKNNPPMTELTSEEEAAVRRDFEDRIRTVQGRHTKRIIIENELVFVPPPKEDGSDKELIQKALLRVPISIQGTLIDLSTDKAFLSLNEGEREEYLRLVRENGFGPLTQNKKRNILCNPYNYKGKVLNIREGSDTSEVQNQGQRSLSEYPFGDSIGDMLARVSTNTGQHNPHILDVGGLMGQALFDIQSEHPNVLTHNLTIDEELGMFPVDDLRIVPAEHMPQEWRERMALIMSHISFRYHTFPDISLMNVIEALAVGGEGIIDFGTDRSSQRIENETAFSLRMKAMMERVKTLHDAGIIQVQVQSGEFPNEKTIDGFGRGIGVWIHIAKKKSMKDLLEADNSSQSAEII